MGEQNAAAHFAAARENYSNGRLIEAIVEYRNAIEADPDFTAAHNSLRYCLREKGEIEDHIRSISAELDIPGGKVTTEESLRERNSLARLCYELGRDDEARDEWGWVASNGTGNPQRSAKKMLRKYYGLIR